MKKILTVLLAVALMTSSAYAGKNCVNCDGPTVCPLDGEGLTGSLFSSDVKSARRQAAKLAALKPPFTSFDEAAKTCKLIAWVGQEGVDEGYGFLCMKMDALSKTPKIASIHMIQQKMETVGTVKKLVIRETKQFSIADMVKGVVLCTKSSALGTFNVVTISSVGKFSEFTGGKVKLKLLTDATAVMSSPYDSIEFVVSMDGGVPKMKERSDAPKGANSVVDKIMFTPNKFCGQMVGIEAVKTYSGATPVATEIVDD